MKHTLLIVDDHELFRQGLSALLKNEKDLRVVGGASDGLEGMKMALEMEPDLVLMGIALPLLNGIEATRRILEKKPHSRILALSAHGSPFYVRKMVQAGALGYVHKSDDLRELVRAIRSALKGVPFMSSSVASKALEDYFQVIKDGKIPQNRAALSARETQILQLIAEGKTSREVSEILQISQKTAENHRHNLMDKLDIHNVAELTLWAVREGIVPV